MSTAKNILITGASSGFGWDTSRALAERGHTVFAGMRAIKGKNAKKAKELSDWAAQAGHTVHVLEMDVTQDASVSKAVSKAVELGGIHVLINNAGVGAMGIQETFTVEQVEDLFAVNVFGVLRVNRAVLPHFRERGSGRVVYLSSGLGRLVFPFMGPYTATKFAIEALAQTAAFELAPLGIESVIVQPGAFGTNFMTNSVQASDSKRVGQYGPVLKILEGWGKGWEERIKAGHIGDPKEISDALVEIAEAPPGSLPARRPVGADVAEPVGALNQLSEQIHEKIFKAFGLK
jgi:NAD(P)-dependent dehydrogenase (short-subunit alcohol dehydrogenase family)